MVNPAPLRRAALAAAVLTLGLVLHPATGARAQTGPDAEPPGSTTRSADAMSEILRGRVVRDGAPVTGVPITLHRVTQSVSGELETQPSGADGGFEFRLPARDTGGFTVFFATAEYQSVRYFGRPLHPDELGAEYLVEVYDTASALPEPVRIARRDLVMIPEQGGGWEVNEIVRIRNPSSRTLVSRSGMPSWEFRIPPAAVDFEAGEGEVPADEVGRMGDRVFLLTPLVPGERELFVRYRIPASERAILLSAESGLDTLNVFVRQPSPGLTVEGLRTTEVLTAGEERFLRYGGSDFAPDARVEIAWTGAGAPPVSPVTAAVMVTVAVLLLGLLQAARARPAATGPGADPGISATAVTGRAEEHGEVAAGAGAPGRRE